MKATMKTAAFALAFAALTAGAFAQDEAAPALSIHGTAETSARAMLTDDALDAINHGGDYADAVIPGASLKLDLDWQGSDTEFTGSLLADPEKIDGHPLDLIDELTLRKYAGNFVIEAGKMKLVWGRGDKLHVTDLFNANDYSDFIFPDYIDRRLGETMARVAWNGPAGIRVEGAWAPCMTADRVPTGGYWAPASATALTALGTSYVTGLASSAYGAAYGTAYADAYANALAALVAQGAKPNDPATVARAQVTAQAAASGAAVIAAQNVKDKYGSVDAFLPNVKTLDYGQYGLRVTGSAGGVDLGAQYYLGHFKTPSWNVKTGLDASGKPAITDFSLDYDRLQSFSVDAAATLMALNLRMECAYYLTADAKGDDPAVKNNSIQWVAGFDVDLPVHNLNFNAQTIGSYVLANDKIENAGDVDWNEDEKWTNDKITVDLSDTFNHEKVKAEMIALWGVERGDIVLQPRLSWRVGEGMSLIATGGCVFSDDDGEFSSFDGNRFAELSAKYEF